jgi:hypothetical protein
MPDLGDALERSRHMIQEALTAARQELEAVHARQSELEEQIGRAETALGNGPSEVDESEGLTLHEALARVLRENDNVWMSVRELADAVNGRGLYRKRDGSPVEVNQVHARANNYGAMFEKNGGRIRLWDESPMLAQHPKSVTVFREDDQGFFEWLDANHGGYFINCDRNPNPRYLVLHLSSCSHIDRSPSKHWTREYVKVCSQARHDLEEWAHETVDGDVTLCGSCFG